MSPTLLPPRQRALRTVRACIAALPALAAACAAPGDSGAWECIAPAGAGGGWDLTCRTVARTLDELGLSPGPVRTINLPGAGGGVGFAHMVSRRRGDSGVLAAASPATTLRLAQRLYGPLGAEDVHWIGALAAEYGVLAVAADAPWATLPELLAAMRRAPDSIVVSGGSAVGGQDHMKVLLLAREAGVDPHRIRYVPFDGGGEAMTALLGGFVQVFSGEASEIEGQVRAGRLRGLVVLGPQRLDGPLASVPTAHEHGLDTEWITWRGFYAPPGLDEAEVRRWVETLDSLGRSEAWARAREASRLRPFFMVGEAFEEFVLRQVEDFRAVSAELGIVAP